MSEAEKEQQITYVEGMPRLAPVAPAGMDELKRDVLADLRDALQYLKNHEHAREVANAFASIKAAISRLESVPRYSPNAAPQSAEGAGKEVMPSETTKGDGEVAELARELYNRFVPSGWDSQDAHEQISAMLKAWASSRTAALRQENERLAREVNKWINHGLKLQAEKDALRQDKTKHDEHLGHVGQFLSEMYGTMIDPCEQPTINIAEMCELLLKTAREHRETAHKVGDAFTKIQNYCVAHDDVIDASWVAKVIAEARPSNEAV
jgi:hypothetical protein